MKKPKKNHSKLLSPTIKIFLLVGTSFIIPILSLVISLYVYIDTWKERVWTEVLRADQFTLSVTNIKKEVEKDIIKLSAMQYSDDKFLSFDRYTALRDSSIQTLEDILIACKKTQNLHLIDLLANGGINWYDIGELSEATSEAIALNITLRELTEKLENRLFESRRRQAEWMVEEKNKLVGNQSTF